MTATLAHLVLPAAHLGHWLWVFYVIPVLIVIGGIVYSTLRERKRGEGKKEGHPRAGEPRP